jgi:hypothetical protein
LEANPEQPALKQVAAVKGVGIGSTMIDRAFEILVQKRLDAQIDQPLPDDLAHKLARGSSFQSIKHNFGTRAATQAAYKLPLDRLGLGISPNFSQPGLRIEAGKMQFSRYTIWNYRTTNIDKWPRSEIQGLFDTQIKGIIGQIGKQLDWMQTNRSSDRVVTDATNSV